MKVTGHKNTDRGERRAADSQIAPKRPRIFSTCAIAPITTIASRAMLKALPLYHSIYPCFTLVSFHSTPLILQPLSQKNRHEGEKKRKPRRKPERNTGKSKHVNGIEPHTEQCCHSKKAWYLIKPGDRLTV